jgi:Ran GTPase-activating protein (RanGAP) involved in mRNA processing and transport
MHAGWKVLKHCLTNNNSVTELRLSHVHTHTHTCMHAGWKALKHGLANNNSVTELRLSNMNRHGGSGQYILTIAEILLEKSRIERLELPYNKLLVSGEVADLLGEDLAENTSLKHLDLFENTVDLRDSAQFLDTLEHHETLEVLRLSDLNDHSVTLLCKALARNRTLKVLDLDNMFTESRGSRAIATLARKNTTMQCLQLPNASLVIRHYTIGQLQALHRRVCTRQSGPGRHYT